jgi:hypothetical protein
MERAAIGESDAAVRPLLVCGMVVGILYLAVGIAQGLVREGFDFSKHALSHLANGPGGWIQSVNLAVSGALVIAAAIGIARVVRPQSKAFGWFLGAFGAGMLASAVFRADPVDGFPPGTPAGAANSLSTSGTLHFAFGGLGFVALAVSAFIMARVLSRRGQPLLSKISLFTGIAVIGGFISPMLGVKSPVAGIWFAVVVGWAWLAGISAHFHRGRAPVA